MIEGSEQAGPGSGTGEEIPQPVQGQVEEAVAETGRLVVLRVRHCLSLDWSRLVTRLA
ncbi:hypothetical protein [Nonomuraea ceibae]|uniref:hypothetical protein n=1 Tax=Nonomuraea ceibae TaxID=1935170 RepID=UPI001C5E2416|nr:hypothetical protein [Nonomuraea ceibae]